MSDPQPIDHTVRVITIPESEQLHHEDEPLRGLFVYDVREMPGCCGFSMKLLDGGETMHLSYDAARWLVPDTYEVRCERDRNPPIASPTIRTILAAREAAK